MMNVNIPNPYRIAVTPHDYLGLRKRYRHREPTTPQDFKKRRFFKISGLVKEHTLNRLQGKTLQAVAHYPKRDCMIEV